MLLAYRSRGRANRNLWLVYSLKMNRDWILGSDRHLVHWILFLETNPDVRSFALEPDDNPPAGGSEELDFDAAADLTAGGREYHKLLLGATAEDRSGLPLEVNESDKKNVRIFTEGDLSARAEEAMRWLKVLSYSAAIRDEAQTGASETAITIMRGLGSGTIRDVVQAMRDFDSQIAIGIISRMAVLGHVALDLSTAGFTFSSPWVWRAAL
ncbi:hypothetical protein [Paraburkholderia sp. MM5477-R1]|uniref:hypothetical protein n=1 Tax=Paraburkholderia sp. MM5477-R1 TaxID=2991062 RepID=UPI003D22B359